MVTAQRGSEAELASEAALRPVPVFESTGSPKTLSLQTLRELWHFREVLSAFVVRQVKVRYKQAVVGIGWSVLQPVASALLFAVFLGRLAHVPSDGSPYLLFALVGMVAWTYFSTALGTAMESVIVDQAMVRKVYFPREIMPLASVSAALVDLAPALLTMIVVAVLFGSFPALSWLLIPIPILILVITAAGLGLGLSALNVYYRDVRHALPFLLQIGLFASPVAYSVSLVPPAWRTLYAVGNPVAGAIDGLRRIVLRGELPDFGTLLGALSWSVVLLVVGYAVFSRLERGFADRI